MERQGYSEYKKVKFDDRIIENESSMSDTSDSDADDITGNDSSDYNERMKFGGPYMVQNYKRSGGVPQNTMKPFAPLMDTQLHQEPEKLQASPQVQSQMSKINEMFSAFIQSSQQGFKVLNSLIDAASYSGMEKESTAYNVKNLETEHDNEAIATFNVKIQNEKEQKAKYSQCTVVTLPVIECVPNNESTKIESVADILSNAPIVLNADADSFIDEVVDLNPDNIINGVIDSDADHIINEIIDSDVANIDEVDGINPNAKFVIVNPVEVPRATEKIKLRMDNIPDFRKNDNLLDGEDVGRDDDEADDDDKKPHAEGLVEDLLPYKEETEAKYMNRSIELLFQPKFFVDSIGWQTGENRINLKNTHILTCWKKSFETEFGLDAKNVRFMAHFKRYKGTKRASNKSAKLKKNAKAKSK